MLSQSIPNLILIIIAGICSFGGTYLLSFYAKTQNVVYVYACFISYALCGLFFAPTLLQKAYTYNGIIWEAVIVIGIILTGFFVAGNHLTLMQWIGVTICIVGIVVASIS